MLMAIISISFSVCFCKQPILLSRYFSLLYIAKNIDILGILLKKYQIFILFDSKNFCKYQ